MLSHCLTVACVALLFAAPHSAAQVLIDPVVVQLGPQQRTATVTVTLSDKAPAPLRLQADIHSWTQDINGGDLTRPSTDLLVAPSISEVKPGQKQLFRIALRGARPSAGELAYRLILEDIAPTPASSVDPKGLTIHFRMRYDLPVLIAPAVVQPDLVRWKPCPSAPPTKSGDACVRLTNAGNRHIKVQELTLQGTSWQQVAHPKDGIVILAGAEREWRLPLQAGRSGPVVGVQLRTARGDIVNAEAGHE